MANVYERNINIKITDDGAEEFCLEATLLDLEHSIRVELVVDAGTGEIEAARAQMMKGPYTICSLALEQVKNLVGARIERGIMSRVAKAVGGVTGCAHLFEVCQAAVQFGANFLLGKRAEYERAGYRGTEGIMRLPEPEQIKLWMPVLKNTCHVFRDEKSDLKRESTT